MLAFLFPGQGSQRVGMGADLGDDPNYRRLMDAGEALSGLPLRSLSTAGPLAALTDTAAAQPAIYITSVALAAALKRAGVSPDAIAGHSLGEYSGAVVAGALGSDQGLSAVVQRGRLMGEAQSRSPGGMAAVMGLELDRVEAICRSAAEDGVVVVANVNSESQVVVSGTIAAVERVMAEAERSGADQVTRLPVGAAFHSPLMADVREAMAGVLRELTWRDPELPIVGGSDGAIRDHGADVRDMLIDQVTAPVRWDICVRSLAGAGFDNFVEVGPGRVLSGLTRLMLPEARTAVVGTLEQVQRVSASSVGVGYDAGGLTTGS